MLSLLRTGLWVVGVCGIVLLVLFKQGWLTAPPVLPPEERRYQAVLTDLRDMVVDDGRTLKQFKFMAHAVLNLAEEKQGMSVYEIHSRKLTLVPPSEDDDESRVRRYLEGERGLWYIPGYGPSRETLENALIEVTRILKERRRDYNADPCLAVITRYIRPPKWGTTQNEAKMRAEMALLYEDRNGGKFFGPKGSTAVCK